MWSLRGIINVTENFYHTPKASDMKRWVPLWGTPLHVRGEDNALEGMIKSSVMEFGYNCHCIASKFKQKP